MATCQLHEDVMTWKFTAALLATIAVVAVGFGTVSATAQAPTKRQLDNKRQFDTQGRPYYGSNSPNASYQQGPHTRVYVTKRSWLDAGVEVLPGDRKFTDYAYPPEVGYPSFARENTTRPPARQPLSSPSDLGGYPTRIPIPY